MSETQPIELEWLEALLTRVEELDVRVRAIERAAERIATILEPGQKEPQVDDLRLGVTRGEDAASATGLGSPLTEAANPRA